MGGGRGGEERKEEECVCVLLCVVRAVVGLINTGADKLLEDTLYTGISPTRSPAAPFSTGKPFHSVLSAIWTICCLSC